MAITVAAGDVLTATKYNANIPQYIQQSSVQALTSTPAAWNAGAASFGAGETWAVDVYIDSYNSSATTVDLQTAWSVTGGATILKRHTIGIAQNVGGTSGDVVIQARTTSTVTDGIANTAGGTHTSHQEHFIVVTTTAGTITLNVSTDAGTASLDTGSYLVAHRLA